MLIKHQLCSNYFNTTVQSHRAFSQVECDEPKKVEVDWGDQTYLTIKFSKASF